MAKLQTDLKEFIGLLNSHGVEYRIDLLTSISGMDFDSAWEKRVESIIDEQPVILIGWNELLRNKKAVGRPKDLADVDKLLAVAKRKGTR